MVVPKPPEKIFEFLEAGKLASLVPALGGHRKCDSPLQRKPEAAPGRGLERGSSVLLHERSADGGGRGVWASPGKAGSTNESHNN